MDGGKGELVRGMRCWRGVCVVDCPLLARGWVGGELEDLLPTVVVSLPRHLLIKFRANIAYKTERSLNRILRQKGLGSVIGCFPEENWKPTP